ncbi:putative clock-controlled gene 13 [Sordaria macrospora k-hell]|nr:putative clock-controlled gene 13 [Sordaria macrospora k-hell]KAH7632515.1 putative clock-controlled protein 13 [Sordaria sp. MPI-SDFR-AT-0083]CCC11894.1 putative clock-controlled gene 13 [Sordaria macrospora k-hell]
MQLTTLLALATAAVSPALAATVPSTVGAAIVNNKCGFPVTLWSVGSTVSAPVALKASSGSYSEKFVKDPVTGGKALKITTTSDGLYTGAPELIFAYSLDGDNIWYDLSSVFGDALKGHKVRVEGKGTGSCGAIEWAQGTQPAGSQTKVCGSKGDVVLTLCA